MFLLFLFHFVVTRCCDEACVVWMIGWLTNAHNRNGSKLLERRSRMMRMRMKMMTTMRMRMTKRVKTMRRRRRRRKKKRKRRSRIDGTKMPNFNSHDLICAPHSDFALS
jgi:hypothetical protein